MGPSRRSARMQSLGTPNQAGDERARRTSSRSATSASSSAGTSAAATASMHSRRTASSAAPRSSFFTVCSAAARRGPASDSSLPRSAALGVMSRRGFATLPRPSAHACTRADPVGAARVVAHACSNACGRLCGCAALRGAGACFGRMLRNAWPAEKPLLPRT